MGNRIRVDVRRVPNPAAIPFLVLNGVHALIWAWTADYLSLLSGFLWALGLLCVGLALYYGWQEYFKSQPELTLYEDYLVLGGEKLLPEEIRVMATRSKALHAVAIIPAGRKLAPRRYVFRMAEYESMGMHWLAVWAERNGVRLEKREYWIAWA